MFKCPRNSRARREEMIRRKTESRVEAREAMRGGAGRAALREVLHPGEMAGVEFVSVVTLDPGASVGEHRHDGSEELYVVLEGSGTGVLDGAPFAVGPGDSFLVKDGHSHGLSNGDAHPMSFLALLTRVGGA
jgi:quercetin dioxygenase-like cupin family protein